MEDYLSPLFYAYQTSNIANGKRLREIANVNPLRKKPRVNQSELVPYVGLPETDDLEIKEVLKRPLSEVDGRNIILKGDILFARIEPSIFNKKYILADKLFGFDYAFTSTEFYVTKAKEPSDQVYLFYSLFTDVVFNQVKGKTTGSTGRRRLDRNIFERIIIPYPSQEIRDKVVMIMNDAVKQKQQKEQQAENLLHSIDDYLLQELGIQLPKPSPNTIANRTFTSSWQKVAGNRFDPKRYTNQNEKLVASISATKEKKVLLKNIVVQSAAGDWGLDEKEISNQNLYQKCLVIRATEFDNKFNLKVENNRVKHRYILKQKLNKLDIRANDFLLEKSGGSPDQPVGRIAILENHLLENESVCYSNFIHKFRIDYNVILPEYLFCFLKTIHNISLTDVMQSQTNGIRNLIMSEYWNQFIPLPTQERQRKIADTIYEMRGAAKQIEIEAQHQFNQTKKQIEQMILE